MSKIAIDIDNTICNTSDFFGPIAEDYDNDKIFKANNWKEIYEYITL